MTATPFVCPLSTDYLSCDEIIKVVNLTISSVQQDPRLNNYPSLLQVLCFWKRLATNNSRTIELDLLYRLLIREVPTHEISIFINHVYRNLLSLNLYFHSSVPYTYPNSLSVVDQLKHKGFYVFPSDIMRSHLSLLRKIVSVSTFSLDDNGRYLSPLTVGGVGRYPLSFSDTQQSYLSSVLHSQQITSLVSCYLNGIHPQCSKVIGWYSFTDSQSSSDYDSLRKRAQQFHIDFEGPSFLKLFVYLSPVTSDSGPHQVFSHPGDHIPPKLRQYERLLGSLDSHIPEFLSSPFLNVSGQVSSIVGERGTMFLVDTSRPHRGLAPLLNCGRLVLNTTFRISNLGNP